MIGRAVTRIVHEINGSGPGHDVNGQTEDQESRADHDAHEIVLEVEPELANIVKVHLRGLD